MVPLERKDEGQKRLRHDGKHADVRRENEDLLLQQHAREELDHIRAVQQREDHIHGHARGRQLVGWRALYVHCLVRDRVLHSNKPLRGERDLLHEVADHALQWVSRRGHRQPVQLLQELLESVVEGPVRHYTQALGHPYPLHHTHMRPQVDAVPGHFREHVCWEGVVERQYRSIHAPPLVTRKHDRVVRGQRRDPLAREPLGVREHGDLWRERCVWVV
mmetsp:Transcript_14493/g.35486  ORF Transcript_14493/g.35486 Transcript_14493/m.35486 type:complete len:218 (+) Transcript_14493:914-1567(+)